MRHGQIPRLLLACTALFCTPPLTAQPSTPATAAIPVDEELILTVRVNGVARGEVTLLRKADGDYWVTPPELDKLKIQSVASAQRSAQGETYYSFRALGATSLRFDAALLALDVEFPATALGLTRIDLSNRPAPLEPTPPGTSAILNYRATARQTSDGGALKLRLATELNVRVGEFLARQETRLDTGALSRRLIRGTSQLIWDDRRAGRRVTAGDQITPGGAFGSTITAGGLSLARVFAITPDVIRQPVAGMQVSALAPAEVEVAVDGNTISRTQVGPGPVQLENLNFYGGTRTVRVTVTDATGRREVIEQPYLFTDSVLAPGLQEYSYFIGRRSEIDAAEQLRYRERVWQAFHRYGATDWLTVQAGGEGNHLFRTAGAGATVRADRLGLLALEGLVSNDAETGLRATGWAARYTYVAPQGTLFLGRRHYGPGFRTFATSAENPHLLDESRIGLSTRLFSLGTMSADFSRGRTSASERSSQALRFSTNLTARASLHADYQSTRVGDEKGWAFNVYMRFDLDRQQWASTTMRALDGGKGIDVDVGRQLPQGEGIGYRLGTTASTRNGQSSAFAFGSANWNLAPTTLEINTVAQAQGGRSYYLEAGASGAVVALGDFIGFTRQVGDSVALARLGVPHPGVDVFLNSQLQGRTDAQGRLLIPQVGAFGRQDIAIDDKQLPMQFNITTKRVTIAPPYKSGTVVDFGARKMRALTGQAWLVQGGVRRPIASRSWPLTGEAGRLLIETASAGDFYLEDAPPGRYAGPIELDGKAYACSLTVPAFGDAVYESREGIVCE